MTLTSGEKVEGYVKRGWHAEASAFKKSNYSFKMTATPDDKEVLKYTADEVVCIDYTEKTENNPDGIRWESRELASPSIAVRYAALYVWKIRESTLLCTGGKTGMSQPISRE